MYQIPKPELDATDWLHLKAGKIPAYRRVWKDGVDVTDRPVSEWPDRMQAAYAGGWRPVVDLDGTFMA